MSSITTSIPPRPVVPPAGFFSRLPGSRVSLPRPFPATAQKLTAAVKVVPAVKPAPVVKPPAASQATQIEAKKRTAETAWYNLFIQLNPAGVEAVNRSDKGMAKFGTWICSLCDSLNVSEWKSNEWSVNQCMTVHPVNGPCAGRLKTKQWTTVRTEFFDDFVPQGFYNEVIDVVSKGMAQARGWKDLEACRKGKKLKSSAAYRAEVKVWKGRQTEALKRKKVEMKLLVQAAEKLQKQDKLPKRP